MRLGGRNVSGVDRQPQGNQYLRRRRRVSQDALLRLRRLVRRRRCIRVSDSQMTWLQAAGTPDRGVRKEEGVNGRTDNPPQAQYPNQLIVPPPILINLCPAL